jgi:hypothetical protein
MFSVISLIYQPIKPYNPSEISSIMMTHWRMLSLAGWSHHSTAEIFLKSTYFRVDFKFFQQKDSMAVESDLSSIISNIYVEHFEKWTLDPGQNKTSLWLLFIDDTFVISPQGPEHLQNFLSHLISIRSSIQFSMETWKKYLSRFHTICKYYIQYDCHFVFPCDIIITQVVYSLCQKDNCFYDFHTELLFTSWSDRKIQ